MKISSLSDLRCPASIGGMACGCLLVCNEAIGYAVPMRHADGDSDEMLEGIVRCSECSHEYPVIAGVLILVDSIETYLSRNNSEILAVAASRVSARIVAYLERRGLDLHDVGYMGNFWRNNLGMGLARLYPN